MKFKPRKILSLLLMILGFSCLSVAQQGEQFTQYMFNRLAFNPAYAGSSGSICAMALYRNQWMGFRLDTPAPGVDAGSTPTDYLFSFDMPVKWLHGGIGLTAIKEEVGYYDNVDVNIDYAFRIYWGPGNLAAAIELNLYSTSLDFSQLRGPDDLSGNYTDPTVSGSSDPLLSNESKSDFLVDVSTGLYYQVPSTFYLGASVKNLLAAHSDDLNFSNARILYLLGGYNIILPFNPSFNVRPTFMAKTSDLATFQAEASCALFYQQTFWCGVSYRFQDAVSLFGGVKWGKLSVGAAYDFTTSRIGTFKQGRSQGTVEAYIKYCFKVIIPPKPPSTYRNTRYLL